MLGSGKCIPFTLLLTITLLLSACGSSASNDPAISTAVAQTISAQNAQQATATLAPETIIITTTPPAFFPTLTPMAPAPSPTRQANKSECAKASLVSETIPDGTIYRPGEQFTKTWEIKNLSNCTWDTSYKIVFWDGEIMGGAYVYNLPQVTPPQGTVPVSLVLTAPSTDNTYTSKWMLQTSDGVDFGVGDYDAPFYTEIIVSSDKKPNYIVTSVDYKIIRTPSGGCATKVTYTAYATITTNGPITLKYRWMQSDGNNAVTGKLIFDAAGVQTVSTKWDLHLGSSPNDHRWFAIVIVDPAYQEFYPGIGFEYTCK